MNMVANTNNNNGVLINIINNADGTNSVRARDLHEFLGITTRYDMWFNRMCEYGFTQGVDFIPHAQKCASGGVSGVKVITDHIITLDMAKELAMIQRTEKGKQARLYFIECEKKLRQQSNPYGSIPKDYKEALQVVLKQLEDIEVMRPKAITYDTVVADAQTTLDRFMRKFPHVNLNRIKRDLYELGYFYVRGGSYRVYAKYRDTFFAERFDPATGKTTIIVLDKGKQELTRLYNEHKLTLKKG